MTTMSRKFEFTLHEAIAVVGISCHKGTGSNGHPDIDVLFRGRQQRVDVCLGDVQRQNRDGQERAKEQALREGFRGDGR